MGQRELAGPAGSIRLLRRFRLLDVVNIGGDVQENESIRVDGECRLHRESGFRQRAEAIRLARHWKQNKAVVGQVPCLDVSKLGSPVVNLRVEVRHSVLRQKVYEGCAPSATAAGAEEPDGARV